jgi:hypothetical protein
LEKNATVTVMRGRASSSLIRTPVTDDDGMIFDDSAPEAHDLVAEFFAARVDFGVYDHDIGRDVGPKRVNVGLEIGLGFRDIGANVAQRFQDEIFGLPAHRLPFRRRLYRFPRRGATTFV